MKSLRSGMLSDAMDALGRVSNASGGFQISHPRLVTVGRAFTLRQVRQEENPEGVARHGEAAKALIGPGDILIIDTPDILDVATWGEGHTLRALASRAAGVVINGAVRDAAALADHALPVLYRSVSPRRSKGRLVTAELGCAVDVCGVAIAPGDLVCFDADGLAAIAPQDEDAILKEVETIQAWEAERDERLRTALESLAR
ncbi:MAG: RraA family protein [Pelagibacterium sp.]|uniref:RraA family protein n=1 Tax=Pelagibacterium sp. TaxID=1967288 RepID=UPI0032ED7BB3